MNYRRHADRLWMAGGALAAAVLLALGWLVMISPERATAAELRVQTEATEISLIKLRHRLAELQEQNGRLGEYQAQLDAHQLALPASTAVPELLRQLQRNGSRADVTVSGVSVGTPVPAKGTVTALPISLTVTGTATNVEKFVVELQDVGPRAVLINTAALTEEGEGRRTTLLLNLSAFFTGSGGQPAAPAPASN